MYDCIDTQTGRINSYPFYSFVLSSFIWHFTLIYFLRN